jgi:integrase/recombinase XerD
VQLTQATVEFLEGYFSTHERQKKTKAAYISDLAQFEAFAGKDVSLVSLSGTVIERYAAHLRKEEYSPASIRRKMVVLRVFCSYWVRRGTLSESPFWRVNLSYGRTEQLPRSLTESEIRAMLIQAHKNHTSVEIDLSQAVKAAARPVTPGMSRQYLSIRNLALVDLLFATGMRVGEASSLDIQDFQLDEAVYKVHGKGGRDRLAFVVDAESLRIQRAYLMTRMEIKTESPALFLNIFCERLSTQGISNVIAQVRKDAGIKRHITPHMLRHTVATLLLRNGVDIRVVQEFLGHASIATTQRYTHVSKEHLIGVLRKSHPSLNLRAGSL